MSKLNLYVNSVSDKNEGVKYNMLFESSWEKAMDYAEFLETVGQDYFLKVDFSKEFEWVDHVMRPSTSVVDFIEELGLYFKLLNESEQAMYREFIKVIGLDSDDITDFMDEGRVVRVYRHGMTFEERFAKWVFEESDLNPYMRFSNEKPEGVVIDYKASGQNLVQKHVIANYEDGDSYYFIWE